jgi:hypothetical protein
MSSAMKVKGADQLLRRLDNLTKQGASRALRKATRAGTTVLGKAVRQAVPVDKGLLKKAETTKVTAKRNRAWGGAGADVAKLNEQAESSAGKRPTNIDHLVESGHVAPDGTFVPPSGFMRRAAATAMPAAEAAFSNKLASEIEREALRG